jgi:signal transduction histidine kinase
MSQDSAHYNLFCHRLHLAFFILHSSLFIFPAFASNDLVSGMDRLNIGGFLVYSGRNSDRDQMIATNFDMPGFAVYKAKEKLVNNEDGDNYHVFKTFFSIAEDFEDENLTLYISYFDTPAIIRINGTVIYRKGLIQETGKGGYSTGNQAAEDVPLAGGLIHYNKENRLVIEIFPLYETSSLPELSIAEYKANASKVFFKNLFNVYLVIAAQFLALLVALYHFGLFISRGCRDKKYIIFSFLSMSFALAYANIGLSFDSSLYTALIKITRCFQLLCFGFFSLYIIESSGLSLRQKKYIIAGIALYSIICTAFVAFQKDKHTITLAFSFISNMYVIPLLLLCIVFPVISIVLRKNYMVVPLLLASLAVSSATLRDILLLNNAVQPLFWYTPYAFLLLIITIYGILIYEESLIYKQLDQSNAILEATVQERTLELKEQTEIALAASRSKSEFLATMSHEIKTPLTVISVHVQQAAELFAANAGNDTNEGESITTSLRRAQQELMRAAHITEDALRFASMQEEHRRKKALRIDTLLTNSAEAYRALLEKRGNKLNLAIADGIGLGRERIYGNADHLAQVMTNLLSNANRHTKDGVITVEAAKLINSIEHGTKFHAEQDGTCIKVTVTDNGSGIAPELLPHVFERGVSGTGGTGVGLEICKKIIESHGGTITAKSTLGKGTAVWFTLPVYIDRGGTDE